MACIITSISTRLPKKLFALILPFFYFLKLKILKRVTNKIELKRELVRIVACEDHK